MDDLFTDIFPALLGVAFCAWWWFIAKETASRKYILLLGICWLVAGMAYIIVTSFDVPAAASVTLDVLGILALIGSIYFLIRAGISEHKARKKTPDD